MSTSTASKGKVDASKAKSEKTTTTTTTATNNNNNRDNKDNKNKDNKRVDKNGKPFPEDPVVTAFDKKIEDLRQKITDLSNECNKLKDEQKTIKEKKDKIQAEIDEINSDNKSIIPLIEKNKKLKQDIDKLTSDFQAKKDKERDFLQSLPVKVMSNSTRLSVLTDIETKAQTIEKRIEAERSVNTQKSLIRELREVNGLKSSIDQYFDQKEVVSSIEAKIRELKEERKQNNLEIDKLLGPERAKKTEKKDGESAIQPATTADSTAEAQTGEKKKKVSDPNSPIGKLIEQRRVLGKRSKEIHEVLKNEKRFDEFKAQIKEEQDKRAAYIKERSEKRKEEKKQQEAERKKQQEEYRLKKELEREQKRLLEIPYENEILNCEDLLRYLSTITPKETKTATSSAQPLQADSVEGYQLLAKKEKRAGPNTKKNNAKAQAQATAQPTDNIKMGMDILVSFEKLSISAPSKYSEINDAKTQLETKLEHFKKLSAKAIEDREKKIAADKEKMASAASTTTETTSNVEVEAQ